MLDSPKPAAPGHDKPNWVIRLRGSLRRTVANGRGRESLTVRQMEALRKRVFTAHVATNEIDEELALTLNLAQRIRASRYAIDGANSRLNFVLDCLLSNPAKLIEARGERLQL